MYEPTSIVDDLLHNSADVAITLSEVEVTQTGGILVVVGVGGELKKSRLGWVFRHNFCCDVRWRASAFVS